jgi:hypothetical protein
MDADLRILFNVPLVLFVVVVVLVVLLVVEGVFARGALNIIVEEEDVVGEEEDIPLLLLLFSSRSEERVRACSSEDIFVIFSLSLFDECFCGVSFFSVFERLCGGGSIFTFFSRKRTFSNSNHMRV